MSLRSFTTATSLAALLAVTATAAADPVSLRFGRVDARPVRPLVLTASADLSPEESLPSALPLPAEHQRERTVFGLPRNVGPIDRVVRVVAGAALVGVGLWGLSSDDHLSDTTSYVLMGVSAVPFATAATAYCPLYHALGIEQSP